MNCFKRLPPTNWLWSRCIPSPQNLTKLFVFFLSLSSSLLTEEVMLSKKFANMSIPERVKRNGRI